MRLGVSDTGRGAVQGFAIITEAIEISCSWSASMFVVFDPIDANRAENPENQVWFGIATMD
jgi:hypothetical protein